MPHYDLGIEDEYGRRYGLPADGRRYAATRDEEKLVVVPASPYQPNKLFDWEDKAMSPIEDMVLGILTLNRSEYGWLVFLPLMAGVVAWFVLEVVMCAIFGHMHGDISWRMPMEMGLVVLFAICGTFLGSIAMFCVLTYRLRIMQLRERKEIREDDYNREILKVTAKNGGKLEITEMGYHR